MTLEVAAPIPHADVDHFNYRGITLSYRKKSAEQHLPESQCGFRTDRSTTDMVVVLWQPKEMCAFVDLTKAFNTVNRRGMWQIIIK